MCLLPPATKDEEETTAIIVVISIAGTVTAANVIFHRR
jgi:hypothetical protein